MNTTNKYRYPGSQPFQDTDLDRQLFYGRERDRQSLLHMVLAGNMVVLFAKSGMGKTSLLNAGLLQQLRERDFIPLLVRLKAPKMDPLEAVYAGIKDAAKRNRVEYNPGEENTLWQHFKTAEFWSSEDILLTPVLILDQFEELFTLHTPESRINFITQLADLVRDRVPEVLRKSLKAGEHFPYSETPSSVKVIISIREDFLGQLEEMSSDIPEIFHNRFRLLALNRDQAKEAIEKPAQIEHEQIKTMRFSYNPKAIDAMLNFLCTRKEKKRTFITNEVEPFQLQLLCHHIETKISENHDKAGAAVEVQEDDLGGTVEMQRVMQDFYDNEINRLGSRSEKKRVRKLCDKGFISMTDRRLSLDEEDIKERFNVSKKLLVELENSRLLRSEPRVGGVYYELSHDTLVEPIRKSNRKYFLPRKLIYSGAIILILLALFAAYYLPNALREKIIEPLVRQGNEFSKQGNDKEAIEKYKEAVEKGANRVDVYDGLGFAYTRSGNYDEALKNYKIAVKIDPNFATYNNLGKAFAKLGEDNEAIKNYKKAIKDNNDFADAYNNLGDALSKQGEDNEAIENYKEAIRINPKNANAYSNMGNLLSKQGKDNEAIKNYKEAIELDRKNANLYSNMGNLLSKLGEDNEAIKNYKKAIELDPKNANAYSNMGNLLSKQGKDNEAIKNYKKAIEIDPENALFYNGLGYAFYRLQRYEEAIENYKKAIRIDPNLTVARDDLKNVLSKQEEEKKLKEH